ncbi:MAG TPA: cyclic-phosphate processing receiver domain-containing protein [Conexivisphaerales archaeon]|nr:cyclic-phosphate processing receiver domain-containing protein [Conexivisphaerales archaeon]
MSKTPTALVLDDDEDRLKKFMAMLDDHSLTLAMTARGAIASLEHNPRYDVAYLDHDLNHSGPTSGTGMDVAVHIARDMSERRRPLKVYVHSHNTSMREKMVKMLRAAGVRAYSRPFRG